MRRRMGREGSPLSLSGNKKQYRPLQFPDQQGLGCDLFGRWAPLLNVTNSEAGVDQCVEHRAYSTVLLHHPFNEPIRHSFAFKSILTNRPCFPAVLPDYPARMPWRHVDRMLDGEDEVPTRDKRLEHGANQLWEVLYIMEGKRTVGELKGFLGQLQIFQVGDLVSHRRINGLSSCPTEHVFGKIQPEDIRRALRTSPPSEPAEPATEIDNALASYVRQH